MGGDLYDQENDGEETQVSGALCYRDGQIRDVRQPDLRHAPLLLQCTHCVYEGLLPAGSNISTTGSRGDEYIWKW